jgi:uncharacterized protein (TIGR00369 family)
MSETLASSGAELAKRFVANSPFAQKLGITVVDVTENGASLELGSDPSLATAGEVVHGGAIATLADTAATVAAWSVADVAGIRNGATVSLTVEYVAAATGQNLLAHARVNKRGRSLVFCEVDVLADSVLVAKALATYRFALAERGDGR